MDFCGDGKMGHLLSGSFDGYFGSLYLLWSVFINTECNKCGQTSRLANGAQIQTSCNCEKDIHSYNCLLDCFCCWRTSFLTTAIRGYVHYIGTALCLAITIVAYSKILFRLCHKQNSSDPSLTRRTPSNSNEHSSIQKGSVQCTVGAGSIGRLLSATYHSDSFNTSKRDAFILLPWLAIYKYFTVCNKLITEPVYLLLEGQRSEISCKRNVKATRPSMERLLYYGLLCFLAINSFQTKT